MDEAGLQRTIDAELKPAAQGLAAEAETAKKRMQAIVDVLSEAIRARNAPLVERHRKDLDGLMGDYARLVARSRALVARVGTLRADDERSKAAKSLAALTKSLGEQQARLDGNYEKLKQMQALANKVLADADSVAARMTKAWAEMEAFLATNVKLYDTRLAQIAALEQAARAAVEARDAKDLAAIQSRADERKGWKPSVSDINMRLIKFFNASGDKLPESLRDQYTRDRVKFNQTFEGLQATDRKIDAHHKAIKALAIKPIDPKKAADAMGIPKGNDARVKKALDAGPTRDALDALARELKLKEDGAELLKRLKKAGLL